MAGWCEDQFVIYLKNQETIGICDFRPNNYYVFWEIDF